MSEGRREGEGKEGEGGGREREEGEGGGREEEEVVYECMCTCVW